MDEKIKEEDLFWNGTLWLEKHDEEEKEKCPCCGSIDRMETMMGFAKGSPDSNRRTCLQCEHSWYTPEQSKIREEWDFYDFN